MRRSLGVVHLHGWTAYGMALFLATGSVLLNGVLSVALLADNGYVVYVPAIALSAWLGGFRAGLLATAVTALLNLWLFVRPAQWPDLDSSDLLRLVVFVLAGILISGLSGRLRDALGEAQSLAREAEAVASIGEQALGGMPMPRLLDAAAGIVADALRTPIVAVHQLGDESRLRLVAGRGWPEGAVGNLEADIGVTSHTGFAMAQEAPVIVSDFRAERRFTPSAELRSLAPRSGIAVRVGRAAQPYGVLAAWSRSPRRFSTDEATFLQSVGNVLAAADSRFQVETESVRARDQLEAVLASVTDGITVQNAQGVVVYANEEAARLMGLETPEQVLATPLDQLMERFDMMDESGAVMPLEELPSRRALRGETGDERLIRFRLRATGQERWSLAQAAPVADESGGVRFAVNIFRDVTAQRRRERADRFLSDATAILATTLDETATIEALAELAIARLADWCVIDVVDRDGSTVRTAIAHEDRDRRAIARQWREVSPLDLQGTVGPAGVIRTGVPELVVDVDGAGVRAALAGDELGDRIAAFGLRSMMIVPLMSRGRAIGAVTMATAESDRRFDEHDLAVASELGERAGVALENARLYRAADERRAELMATLAAMGEAVLVFDAGDRLLLRNPAADALMPGDAPRTLDELRTELDLGAHTALGWPAAATEAPIEVRRSDGRWLEVAAYRAAAGGADGATDGERSRGGSTILVVRDVTAQRAARAAREAFMGLLSHELRTPITTIYGGTRLLERSLREEQRAEVVRDIRAEAERLYRLVEDLLVMTRVERGGVEIGDEPILLQRILDPVVRTEEARWPGLVVETSFSNVLPAVRGDLTYVEQVIRNLLGNAAKYGGTGDPVELVAEDLEAQVAVRVLDRGPGISADEAERLFDLFYRGSSTADTASGAGIGLFVCRALVTAMGGRMWASPREGGGSEFGFSLPVLEIDEVP